MKKKNRVLNKVFAFMLAGTLVLPFGVASFANASNWTDTEYYQRYTGDGGDVSSGARTKTDDSYVYIKHAGDVGILVAIHVVGYEGNYTGMHGNGNYVGVPLGVGYKITNYVAESFRLDYENGRYKNIALRMSPNTHSPCYIHGVWSPDSI